MYSGKLQEGHFPVVCVYKKSAFTLTLGSDVITVSRVVFGQAKCSFPFPSSGPIPQCSSGSQVLCETVALHCCAQQLRVVALSRETQDVVGLCVMCQIVKLQQI